MPDNTSIDAMPCAVEFVGVSKSYGDYLALTDLNLKIENNARVAIIGPSGSGKTTLLRVLMTLEKIDDGEIKLFGKTLVSASKPIPERDAATVRANLGMVFQQFNLFPHRTALENVIEAPIYVQRIPRSEAVERGIELLKLVGLEQKADSYPKELSGGQQQRVAIARTLAMNPRIILFDEVTSALDPELVDEVLGVMRRLAQEHRITMLIVTHEMRFAREISDRTIFMERGKVVEDGVSEAVFGSPQNQRTREFLKLEYGPT